LRLLRRLLQWLSRLLGRLRRLHRLLRPDRRPGRLLSGPELTGLLAPGVAGSEAAADRDEGADRPRGGGAKPAPGRER
jgi:hypothetical protein